MLMRAFILDVKPGSRAIEYGSWTGCRKCSVDEMMVPVGSEGGCLHAHADGFHGILSNEGIGIATGLGYFELHGRLACDSGCSIHPLILIMYIVMENHTLGISSAPLFLTRPPFSYLLLEDERQ